MQYVPNNGRGKSHKIWLYYKLGMYKEAIALNTTYLNCKVKVAQIISYAHLGELNNSLELLKSLKKCEKYYSLLLSSLSPYLTQDIFDIFKDKKISDFKYSIYLIKLGKYDEAKEYLEVFIKNKLYIKNPEVFLYFSNIANNYSFMQKLELFNRYLETFGLSKIELKNTTNPLFVYNIIGTKVDYIDSKSLVSIIMTTYNSSSYVQSALYSLLNQSYRNIEIFVVDDCSEDDTVEKIKEIALVDNRIKLIELSQNVGTYEAKNRALQKVNGEFITCHDSDDFSHPLKIEKQVEQLLKDKTLIASISYWIRIDKDGNYYSRYVSSLLRLNSSSLMYRKYVIKDIGYYDSVRTGADSEFYARLLLKYGKKNILRVKQPLSLGAHRENSLMTAKSTGSIDKIISKSRLEYWEYWNRWHLKEITNNQFPYLSFGHSIKKKIEALKK